MLPFILEVFFSDAVKLSLFTLTLQTIENKLRNLNRISLFHGFVKQNCTEKKMRRQIYSPGDEKREKRILQYPNLS